MITFSDIYRRRKNLEEKKKQGHDNNKEKSNLLFTYSGFQALKEKCHKKKEESIIKCLEQIEENKNVEVEVFTDDMLGYEIHCQVKARDIIDDDDFIVYVENVIFPYIDREFIINKHYVQDISREELYSPSNYLIEYVVEFNLKRK